MSSPNIELTLEKLINNVIENPGLKPNEEVIKMGFEVIKTSFDNFLKNDKNRENEFYKLMQDPQKQQQFKELLTPKFYKEMYTKHIKPCIYKFRDKLKEKVPNLVTQSKVPNPVTQSKGSIWKRGGSYKYLSLKSKKLNKKQKKMKNSIFIQ